MLKAEELNFVRVTQPNVFQLIPRHLFEQNRDLDPETIDRIYKFGPGLLESPTTLIWIMTDKTHKIRGMMWAEVNFVEAQMYVVFLSVEKEYQDKSLIPFAVDFLKKKMQSSQLKDSIIFATTRPKAFEKLGARRPKRTLMEI